MTTRAAKILLVGGLALYYALVVFNNLTDFNSNYTLVQHVLGMDSTFPGNHGGWRAIGSPALHRAAFFAIIAWEILTTALLAWGVARMIRAYGAPPTAFSRASNVAVLALLASQLMWIVGFLTIGGEWFLMWQSRDWNGEQAAFRMCTIVGLVLLLVVQPEREAQP